jgi:small subunit ribosomal protein S9
MIEGLGRRKASIARIFMKPGAGKIIVNDKDLNVYFNRMFHVNKVLEPLELLDKKNAYDINIKVKGGGQTGQSGAIRLGIARALVKDNEDYKKKLREAGYLTRDSRVVERKKYGQPKARKKFQFSKR